MSEAVLDASAVLAYLQAEPGGETVAELLPSSVISAINYGEVVNKLIRSGLSGDAAVRVTNQLACDVRPLDRHVAAEAAKLYFVTYAAGLSLADRCCLALAKQEGAPAVTADKAWSSIDAGVVVELIR